MIFLNPQIYWEIWKHLLQTFSKRLVLSSFSCIAIGVLHLENNCKIHDKHFDWHKHQAKKKMWYDPPESKYQNVSTCCVTLSLMTTIYWGFKIFQIIVLDPLQTYNYHSISHNGNNPILCMRKITVSKLSKFVLPHTNDRKLRVK